MLTHTHTHTYVRVHACTHTYTNRDMQTHALTHVHLILTSPLPVRANTQVHIHRFALTLVIVENEIVSIPITVEKVQSGLAAIVTQPQ